MGKRRLHGLSYHQCDWTGIPMRNSNCYMPDFSRGDLFKKGHYCNWEAVVAHALHMRSVQQLNEIDLQKILEHVNQVTGRKVKAAAPVLLLRHLGGDLSIEEWHKLCCREPSSKAFRTIVATPEGRVYEDSCLQSDTMFEHYQCVSTSRKIKGTTHGVDIYFHILPCISTGYDESHINTSATQHIKSINGMTVRGDAIYVLKSRENCFLARDEPINMSMTDYETLLGKKRKKAQVQEEALSTEDYHQVKSQMQVSLSEYEARVSASAVTPMELVAGAKMPAPIGKELAALAEHMGCENPKKKAKKVDFEESAELPAAAESAPPEVDQIQPTAALVEVAA